MRLVSIILVCLALAACATPRGPLEPPGDRGQFDPVTGLLGPPVGTAIAQVELRQAYLQDDDAAVQKLIGQLRPLDIIIEKNGHRLSDSVIPGYFTHARVWVGTEQQLRQRGIWNAPELEPLREAIAAGKVMIESDYKGLRLEPVLLIGHSDEIVVLRPTRVRSTQQMREIYSRIAKELEKPYDFAFDADSPRTSNCAELVARADFGITWRYSTLGGRRSLLPDDMVSVALGGTSGVRVQRYLVGDKAGGAEFRSSAAVRQVMAEKR